MKFFILAFLLLLPLLTLRHLRIAVVVVTFPLFSCLSMTWCTVIAVPLFPFVATSFTRFNSFFAHIVSGPWTNTRISFLSFSSVFHLAFSFSHIFHSFSSRSKYNFSFSSSVSMPFTLSSCYMTTTFIVSGCSCFGFDCLSPFQFRCVCATLFSVYDCARVFQWTIFIASGGKITMCTIRMCVEQMRDCVAINERREKKICKSDDNGDANIF